MATTDIEITDYSDTEISISITDEAYSGATPTVEENIIKKGTYTTEVSGNSVFIYWKTPETMRDRQIRELDYSVVSYPTVASASELQSNLNTLNNQDTLRISRQLLYIG